MGMMELGGGGVTAPRSPPPGTAVAVVTEAAKEVPKAVSESGRGERHWQGVTGAGWAIRGAGCRHHTQYRRSKSSESQRAAS